MCRNRKGDVSQNVLGVVDFHMLFTYVLAGWEGSAHDGRVLDDAVTKGLLLFLSGNIWSRKEEIFNTYFDEIVSIRIPNTDCHRSILSA